MTISIINVIAHYLTFRRELSELYLSVILRNLAISTVVLFEPIYLYRLFDNSLTATLLFFAAASLLFGLLAATSPWLIDRFGKKHLMLFSVPFLFGYYVLLWQAVMVPPLLFVPLALALHVGGDLFYWPAFHLDFLHASLRGRRGREFSLLSVLSSVAVIAGPLLGGAILSVFGSWGFPVLFGAVLFVLALSGFVLLLTPDGRDHMAASYGEIWRLMFSKKFVRAAVAFASHGAETTIEIVVWPVFLFVIAFSYGGIGMLGAAASAAAMVATLLTGRLADGISKKKLIVLGSALNAAVWLAKTFSRAHPALFILHLFHGSVRSAAVVPFMALTYDRASDAEWGASSHIIFREVTHNIGRGLLLVALALVLLFTDNVALAFIPAAFFALLMSVI